jgi:hypothetical protein
MVTKKQIFVTLGLCTFAYALGIVTPGLRTPNTGAYQATLVLQNGQRQLKGIAVIQEHMITADGESAKIERWEETGNMLTAYAADGSMIFKLERTGPGVFEQPHPNGRLVFRRYDLPELVAW